MDNLVLHPHTRRHLEVFLTEPPHALLLTGAAGVGKKTIAQVLTATILGISPSKLESHPYHMFVTTDEKGTISIETIRAIQKFLQLRTTGTSFIRRVVIVENAHGLTTEAQNAFLKLLEEPPFDTIVVLTTSNIQALLPTIRSRVQQLAVHPPEEAQLMRYFRSLDRDETLVTQAKFLSGGLPGLMHALLGEEEHPLLASVRTAKEILQKDIFERLAMVDTLAKQKTELNNLLEALLRISMSAQAQAAAKNDTARIKQWHAIRKEVLSAQAAYTQNANAKLVLTKMLLHI